ncbi:MAG: hypothetical protein HRU29_01650 [Rhizobiales bacterium]|nr:hypothetical protein [Hyphomicrobiales bacterium]NRB13079.1 hypothetical protein [Hyphomicrobiales bacterium]
MNIEISHGDDILASYHAELAPSVGDKVIFYDTNIQNNYEVISREFCFFPDGNGGRTCGVVICIKAVGK